MVSHRERRVFVFYHTENTENAEYLFFITQRTQSTRSFFVFYHTENAEYTELFLFLPFRNKLKLCVLCVLCVIKNKKTLCPLCETLNSAKQS
jgi:hypothetical protein